MLCRFLYGLQVKSCALACWDNGSYRDKTVEQSFCTTFYAFLADSATIKTS